MKRIAFLFLAFLFLALPAAAQDRQIALPDALQGEAGRIMQLLYNEGHWLFGYGPAHRFESEWPAPNAVTYDTGQDGAQLLLTNIRVVDFGHIEWSQEHELHRNREEHVLSTLELVEGQTVSDQFSWTFAKARSLQETSKLGFEQAVEAHVGSYESPAGASITAKFDQEFSRTFGSTETTTNTISRTITTTGPLRAEIVATRDSVVAQRTTRTQPKFDYQIQWAHGCCEGRGTTRVTWANKDEFLRFVRGAADDSVGIAHLALGGETRKLAPYYRAHPQPNAVIDDSSPWINWTDTYDTSIRLNLETKPLDP